MTNATEPLSIPWHQLLGALLEMALTPVDIQVETEVQVTAEPPKIDILLLRRKTARWTAEQRALLPDGIRESNASHQLLEFKYSESVSEESLAQAVVYEHFYRTARRLGRNAVQVWVISSKTPRSKRLQEWGYAETDWPGVYHSSYVLVNRVGLLALNQLSDASYNAFVKVFASRQEEKETAFRQFERIKELETPTRTFLRGLRQIVQVEEENTMAVIATPEYVMRLGEDMRRVLLETLTPQELIALLRPEQRLAGLKPEERLAGLKPEERVAGLKPEERVAGIEPEQILPLFSIGDIEEYLRQHRPGGKDAGGVELN